VSGIVETSDTIEIECWCGEKTLVESLGFGSTAQSGVAIFKMTHCGKCQSPVGFDVGHCLISTRWKAIHGKP
jgi:hypothetical protein